MKQLPNQQTHILTQPNTSDVLGDLYVTKGTDLTDNLGKVRLGKRMLVNINTTDNISLADVPVGFREHNTSGDKLYAVAGGGVFVSAAGYPSSGFTVDVGFSFTNAPNATQSDIEIYGSDLYVTTTTDLCKLAASTWSVVDSTLGSGSVHLMCSYAGLLYVTDSNFKIYSWNGSSFTKSGQFSLNLGANDDTVITFMRAAGDCIWIGTVNQNGDKAYIYKWDGAATSPTAQYKLSTAGVVSGLVVDDVLYCIDVYGRLLAWNGGTFEEVARLNRRTNKLFKNPLSNLNNRFMHPNGMSVIDGRINLLINTSHNDSTSSLDETMPAGIYEYDQAIGLYHKHSLSLTHSGDTIIDYGASRISSAGALYEANFPDTSTSRNGTFLAGANLFTSATATTSAILYDDSNDTLQKSGYLVSTKIEATDGSPYNFPTVEAMWQSYYTIYRDFLNSTDQIVPKYRIHDVPAIEATITWVTSTTFSVPVSSLTMSTYWTSGTGGEVEILQGVGAGHCSHITNVQTLGSIYLVTTDETYLNATGTAQARFNTWKKISLITPNNQKFNSDTISVKSTWIQFKTVQTWSGRNEIERIMISNSNATPVK